MRWTALTVLLALMPMQPALAAPETTKIAQVIEEQIEAGDIDGAGRRLAAGDFSPLLRLTLEGRLALAKGEPDRAARKFQGAVKLAPGHAPLRLLLAHAQFAAEDYRDVIVTTDHPDISRDDEGVVLLRAASYEGLDKAASAYAELRGVAMAHPATVSLRRELVLLCVRHGLYDTADEWARTVSPSQLGRDTAQRALKTMRNAESTTRASETFARRLVAAFPDDAQLRGELGWVLSRHGRIEDAAEQLATATRMGADFAHAAADHFRGARRYRDALKFNARVQSAELRAQQRFDILFEQGAMARAVVAGETLADSHGLSARRRYNLAYSLYALRQYEQASAQARRLSGTTEADRAAQLLRAMGR